MPEAAELERQYRAMGASPEQIKSVLGEITYQIKQYGKHIKATNQAVGKHTKGAYLADVSAASQGLDFAGQEKMPLGAEALIGFKTTCQVEQISEAEWQFDRDAGFTTPIDDMVEHAYENIQAENAATVALFQARATSERSNIPDIWRGHLLGAEVKKEEEPEPDLEERRKKWIEFVKSQEASG